jgi:hypothetical protein
MPLTLPQDTIMKEPNYVMVTTLARPVLDEAGKGDVDAEARALAASFNAGDSKPLIEAAAGNVHVTLAGDHDWGSVLVVHLENEDITKWKKPAA